MHQWPPPEVGLAAARLHFLLQASWNGEYVTEEKIFKALNEVKKQIFFMPPRPEHLPKGRAALGPKMLEDCAAICALKGEVPDEPRE
jgi:hypothetical protein